MENIKYLIPAEIKQANSNTLEIIWQDGKKNRFQVRDLRLACRCAHCVDEWSGSVKIQSSTIPDDVKPVAIEAVGRYGLKIQWSDGHNAGIYSYDYLKSLAEQKK